MSKHSFIFLLSTFLGILSLSNVARSSEQIMGHHHPGDRVSVRGMVLFGVAPNELYMAHIPMFSRNHNEQLIAKVSLGSPDRSFNDQSYSLKPKKQFSLDDRPDWINDRLRSLKESRGKKPEVRHGEAGNTFYVTLKTIQFGDMFCRESAFLFCDQEG